MQRYSVWAGLLFASSSSAIGQPCAPAWSSLGAGPGPTAMRAISFDLGDGPALYAMNGLGLQRWNGTAWNVLHHQVGNVGLVGADDGSGRAIYFGSHQVWRWRNGTMEQVGNVLPQNLPTHLVGLEGSVTAQPRLMAALAASSSQPNPTFCGTVRAWDGTEWTTAQTLTTGKPGNCVIPNGMLLFESKYYVTCSSSGWSWMRGGSIPIGHSTSLLPVQACGASPCGTSGFPRAVIRSDLGNGPRVYMGGCFNYLRVNCLQPPVGRNIAHWTDPAIGEQVGEGLTTAVDSLATFDDGAGVALYAGGTGLHRWDGASWTSMGVVGSVRSLVVHDDGNGQALFVFGSFSINGQPGIANAARWGRPACYANCDGSLGCPGLTANDFQCFVDRYAVGDARANCDQSSGTPLLTPNDLLCFVNRFAAGCLN